MPLIRLSTEIRAPIERCFDLARSIDFHQKSVGDTEERAVAGVVRGLIGLDQTVTWEAKHFGVRQRLQVKIVEFEAPHYFRDVMQRGAFALLDHRHRFAYRDGTTTMTDEFRFRSPLGPLGTLVDALVLTRYMRGLLLERNRILKQTAESEQWQAYLGSPAS